MQRIMLIAWLAATTAVAAGCAGTPTNGALATPWGVAGVHSFKPEPLPPEPNAAKVDKQVAQLLDDASRKDQDPGVRVAATSR